MSLADSTSAAALRSAVIALLAISITFALRARAPRLSRGAQSALLTLAGIAYFTPGMLAGYGWLGTVAQWAKGSWQRESFYTLAMVLRFAPIAWLALWMAQSGPDASARHSHRLAGLSGWRWWLREAGAAPWLAAGGVFLLAFQEFDVATSWGIKTWTVALFDAQVGGLALSESLQLAILPCSVELFVIVGLMVGLRRTVSAPAARAEPGAAWPTLTALGFAPLALFCIVPGALLFHLSMDGFRAWLEMPGMLPEIGHSCVSAAAAAGAAWVIARTASPRWLGLLAVPGLLGPLLVALLVFAASPAALTATVLPWLLALILSVLPIAILLRVLLDRGTDPEAWHAAQLSNARAAMWSLKRFRSVAALLLLFCTAYGDFTIATIVAPAQFTTVFPRIFNLMHYGRSAVLSVTMLIAVLTPLVAFGFTVLGLRFYVRRIAR